MVNESTNVSVCKLDLRITEYNNRSWFFNSEEYSVLIRSPLGMQCEQLSINLEKRADIVHLIDSMIDLRQLTAGLQNNIEDNLFGPSMDRFVTWLRRRSPPNYTVSYSRNNILITKG